MYTGYTVNGALSIYAPVLLQISSTIVSSSDSHSILGVKQPFPSVQQSLALHPLNLHTYNTIINKSPPPPKKHNKKTNETKKKFKKKTNQPKTKKERH